MKVWLFVLPLALMCVTAHAQTTSLSIQLESFDERPAALSAQRPYAESLEEALRGTLSSFVNARRCESAIVRSVAFADVSSVDQATQRLTESGGKIFNERMHAEICGAQYMPNYYVLALPGQPIRFTEGVPGQTRASPLLQADVQPQVLRVARTLAECAEPNVIGLAHTTVDQAPPQGGGSWQETWIVSACGKRVDIPVAFEPSAQGGITYSVRGDGARVR